MWECYFDVPPVTWRSFAEYLDDVEAGGCAHQRRRARGPRRAAHRRDGLRRARRRRARARRHEGTCWRRAWPPALSACRRASSTRRAATRRPTSSSRSPGSSRPSTASTPPTCAASARRSSRRSKRPCASVARPACRCRSRTTCPSGAGRRPPRTSAVIDRARAEGLDVTLDNDIHTELAPRLSRALPQPLHSLAVDELVAVLRDPGRRAALAATSPPTTTGPARATPASCGTAASSASSCLTHPTLRCSAARSPTSPRRAAPTPSTRSST